MGIDRNGKVPRREGGQRQAIYSNRNTSKLFNQTNQSSTQHSGEPVQLIEQEAHHSTMLEKDKFMNTLQKEEPSKETANTSQICYPISSKQIDNWTSIHRGGKGSKSVSKNSPVAKQSGQGKYKLNRYNLNEFHNNSVIQINRPSIEDRTVLDYIGQSRTNNVNQSVLEEYDSRAFFDSSIGGRQLENKRHCQKSELDFKLLKQIRDSAAKQRIIQAMSFRNDQNKIKNANSSQASRKGIKIIPKLQKTNDSISFQRSSCGGLIYGSASMSSGLQNNDKLKSIGKDIEVKARPRIPQ